MVHPVPVLLRSSLLAALKVRQLHRVERHITVSTTTHIVRIVARTAPLQIFLWDRYNPAEVLQLELLMNNGGVLFVRCVDTDTVAALLMGPRHIAVRWRSLQ